MARVHIGWTLPVVLLITVALQALMWPHPVLPLGTSHASDLISTVAYFTWSAVGWLVLARRPGNRVGVILLISGLAGQIWVMLAYYAALDLLVWHGSLPGAVAAAWAVAWLPTVAWGLACTFLFLVFPDGRLPSRRWRSFAIFVGVADGLWLLHWATEPGPMGGAFMMMENPAGIEIVGRLDPGTGWMLFMLAVVGSAIAPFVRLRRSTGVQRQQLKWFTYTAALVALTWVATTVGSEVGAPVTTIADRMGDVAQFALPLAVFIAIFRHNLYDIDVVISRTIVFGLLAAVVTGGYVAVVAGVGGAIGWAGETGLGLSVIATAVVAVVFQPTRSRAQRLANRLVYGQRATPYEVLTTLARRMRDAYAPEDLLPQLAQSLAEGTGASQVQVWLRTDRHLQRVASWPRRSNRQAPLALTDEALSIPDASELAVVRHQGEVVGALAVSLPPGQALTETERRLLADLAAQVGVVLDNLRLIEELMASRMRIVAAHDEERRRIERDIHDGVQQRLVSLSLALRMAANGHPDHDQAKVLADAAAEARAALDELRRLARGIHPAILTEGGLLAALESLAERSPVPAQVVRVPPEPLPAAVEVTTYYLVAEALANTAKHAEAATVWINVDRSDAGIRVTVADDGVGGATTGVGSGLIGLIDRVAALKGTLHIYSPDGHGTRLIADIPCASS